MNKDIVNIISPMFLMKGHHKKVTALQPSKTDKGQEVNNTSPTIVLNMIVKNESRVIERMLKSVSPLIDYYVICDTGSTDETPNIIRRFFEKNYPQIQGHVIYHPFRDFGYNRTYSLHKCQELFPQGDFVLLMDADMVIWVDPNVFRPDEFKRGLTNVGADVYLLFQGSAEFHTKNARICRNCKGFSYRGVTHEYLDSPPQSKSITIDRSNIHILDVGDGGAKTDKFERDIRLLETGLQNEPENGRYMFYLGNSYKDSGQYEKAIDIYKKRIQQGGWVEETWLCHYNTGVCFKMMGKMAEAYKSWISALDVFPNRIENLYEIIYDSRLTGKNYTAYYFYEMAKQIISINPNLDFLFTQADVYHWKLDFEFSIIAFYIPSVMELSKRPSILNTCMNLMSLPFFPTDTFKNVLNNYKFYVLPLPIIDRWKSQTLTLHGNQTGEFINSTPSIVRHKTGTDTDECYWINIRFVNYRVNEQGGYDNKDKIHTRNILFKKNTAISVQEISDPVEIQYNTEFDNVYVGLEDIRLFSHLGELYYNANRGIGSGKMQVEHGKIHTETGETYESRLLKSPENREIEKNWVMFSKGNDLLFIYDWGPLRIGRLTEDGRSLNIEIVQPEVPAFFRQVRGSTNGVYLADQREIWFLCHLVSYEERRRYYHLFIVLDGDTMVLKKWTPLFVFEKEQPVEYSLGFVIDNGGKNWIISKSSMDQTTEFLVVPIKDIQFVQTA